MNEIIEPISGEIENIILSVIIIFVFISISPYLPQETIGHISDLIKMILDIGSIIFISCVFMLYIKYSSKL